MARARDPKRNEAYELYKSANGDIKLKDVAERLGVAEGTVRGWKNKDRWDDRLEEESNGTFRKKEANNTERSVKKNPKRSKAQPEAETKATVQFEIVPSDGLNSQQLLFCMYYTKYWNATKAYQKVYGCDYASAMSNGSRLLRNDKVRDEIARLKAELANGIMLNARTVLQMYIDIAFADITDFVDFGTRTYTSKEYAGEDDEGKSVFKEETHEYSFVGLKEAHEVDGTIITEVKKGKDGVSVKLADKMAALAMLAKYTDVLDETVSKQLQSEQAKLNIDKTKVEIENIKAGNKNQSAEDWVAALGKVAERRKVKAHE
ncbi:terminase small subunit [Lysinibacillus sp. NPDC094403]|uniref:terminase small subunit n=1 Tax=Lysinibacillus sp. NPDC094403 TaxID=3390581 RepID=UPI003CFC0108